MQKWKALLLIILLVSPKASSEIIYEKNTTPEQKAKIEAAYDLLTAENPKSAAVQYRIKPGAKGYIGSAVLGTHDKGNPFYLFGTNKISLPVKVFKDTRYLAMTLLHEFEHLKSAISSPELIALNKALVKNTMENELAQILMSEATAWTAGTMASLNGKGKGKFIKDCISADTIYSSKEKLKDRPNMINYLMPQNYICALIAHYYGKGAVNMPETQKIAEIGNDIYNNFYKNAGYINESFWNMNIMFGDKDFIDNDKYSNESAMVVFLERYMELTTPKGVTRMISGSDVKRLVMEVINSDEFLVEENDSEEARKKIRKNFAKVKENWDDNTQLVKLIPGIVRKIKATETMLSEILTQPITPEEFEILDRLLTP